MKRWSRKFLNRKCYGKTCPRKENGDKAQKAIKIPSKLYVQISEKARFSELLYSIRNREDVGIEERLETAIAAGVCIGWAEKEKRVK